MVNIYFSIFSADYSDCLVLHFDVRKVGYIVEEQPAKYDSSEGKILSDMELSEVLGVSNTSDSRLSPFREKTKRFISSSSTN